MHQVISMRWACFRRTQLASVERAERQRHGQPDELFQAAVARLQYQRFVAYAAQSSRLVKHQAGAAVSQLVRRLHLGEG